MNTLLMLFLFVPILAVLLLGLNLLLASHKPDEAKVSAYECGFSPVYGQTRSTFQIHFFLVALLFLVFDLEILLLFPIALTLYQVSMFGFSIALIFFIVLTIGFVLEIGSGAIKVTSNYVEILDFSININKKKKNVR
jgi:NADH:ubiquinone oxidoreductase subunit 3 (subunit A)